MAPLRKTLARRLADLVGGNVLTITDVGNGWPARGTLLVSGRRVQIDLFVGPVRESQRNRDDVERRFQNPGTNRPIVLTNGRLPLLIGVWDEDDLVPVAHPVIVLADPYRRVGSLTRVSIFQTLTALVEASTTGWVTQTTTSGETMLFVHPALLPLAVEARGDEIILADDLVQSAVLGSGLVDGTGDHLQAAERVRRATSAIVRDARFGRRVIAAYNGLCAMCGLDAGLVQGAHIYPASAPNSPDEPWNGLALCPTHHLAFDRHLVGVRPDDGAIRFGDKLREQVALNPAARALVEGTFDTLKVPTAVDARPRRGMFELRYAHFNGQYEWLGIAS